MVLLVRLIGALFVAFGSMISVRTAYLRRIFEYFREGHRVYLAGVIRLIIGLILIAGSRNSLMEWWVAFVGFLCIWSAILIFLLKIASLRGFIEWWLEKKDSYLAAAGVIVALIGISLLLAA